MSNTVKIVRLTEIVKKALSTFPDVAAELRDASTISTNRIQHAMSAISTVSNFILKQYEEDKGSARSFVTALLRKEEFVLNLLEILAISLRYPFGNTKRLRSYVILRRMACAMVSKIIRYGSEASSVPAIVISTARAVVRTHTLQCYSRLLRKALDELLASMPDTLLLSERLSATLELCEEVGLLVMPLLETAAIPGTSPLHVAYVADLSVALSRSGVLENTARCVLHAVLHGERDQPGGRLPAAGKGSSAAAAAAAAAAQATQVVKTQAETGAMSFSIDFLLGAFLYLSGTAIQAAPKRQSSIRSALAGPCLTHLLVVQAVHTMCALDDGRLYGLDSGLRSGLRVLLGRDVEELGLARLHPRPFEALLTFAREPAARQALWPNPHHAAATCYRLLLRLAGVSMRSEEQRALLGRSAAALSDAEKALRDKASMLLSSHDAWDIADACLGTAGWLVRTATEGPAGAGGALPGSDFGPGDSSGSGNGGDARTTLAGAGLLSSGAKGGGGGASGRALPPGWWRAMLRLALAARAGHEERVAWLLRMGVGSLPAGAPPAQPPPALAAALSAGLLPCLERMLRTGLPASAAAGNHVPALRILGDLLLHPVDGADGGVPAGAVLLSYGEPRQAAALVATVGKVLRAATAGSHEQLTAVLVAERDLLYEAPVLRRGGTAPFRPALAATGAGSLATDLLRGLMRAARAQGEWREERCAAGPNAAGTVGPGEASDPRVADPAAQLRLMLSLALRAWLPPLMTLLYGCIAVPRGAGVGRGREEVLTPLLSGLLELLEAALPCALGSAESARGASAAWAAGAGPAAAPTDRAVSSLHGGVALTAAATAAAAAAAAAAAQAAAPLPAAGAEQQGQHAPLAVAVEVTAAGAASAPQEAGRPQGMGGRPQAPCVAAGAASLRLWLLSEAHAGMTLERILAEYGRELDARGALGPQLQSLGASVARCVLLMARLFGRHLLAIPLLYATARQRRSRAYGEGARCSWTSDVVRGLAAALTGRAHSGLVSQLECLAWALEAEEERPLEPKSLLCALSLPPAQDVLAGSDLARLPPLLLSPGALAGSLPTPPGCANPACANLAGHSEAELPTPFGGEEAGWEGQEGRAFCSIACAEPPA